MLIEPWLLGVIAFLWLSAAGLITMGTRQIFVGIKLFNIAKATHATYSLRQSASELKDSSDKAINYKEALEQLENVKNSPQDFAEFKQYVEKMFTADKKASELLKKINGDLAFAYKAGIRRGSTGFVEQADATKSFALAAAFFAIASIAIGINSTFIAIF